MMKFLTPTVPETPKIDFFNVRLPAGTAKRIDNVLNGGELRSAFIRHAVEAELQRRESAVHAAEN
jgi:hypothetical protein